MFIIAPLSNCASPAKRDRFVEYISKIAPVTLKNEERCRAYAWFKSAEDNSAVPHHWLRGLEVYEDAEANTVTHRSSTEYKAFRAAVGEEGLLERPSDLRFWKPSTVGYLTRSNEDDSSTNFIARGSGALCESQQYIAIDELTPRPGQKDECLNQMRSLVALAERQILVLSFWVLHRGDNDDNLLVFARYDNKDAATRFCNRKDISGIREAIASLTEQQRTTTWVESGLGFIGRQDRSN